MNALIIYIVLLAIGCAFVYGAFKTKEKPKPPQPHNRMPVYDPCDDVIF